MSRPLIRLTSVHARRGDRVLLDALDLTIEPGSSVAIVGPSGSGKSTLLALIAGLERPDTGTVQHAVRKEDIGLVLQGHGLISLLTAEENVALPLQAPGRPRLGRTEVHRRALAALGEVGLDPAADHLVEALSGGQQQRVAVARALVTTPKLLIADEPTAALDAANREHIADMLFALPARGTSILIATHDTALAARADLLLAVESGRVGPA